MREEELKTKEIVRVGDRMRMGVLSHLMEIFNGCLSLSRYTLPFSCDTMLSTLLLPLFSSSLSSL